MKSMTIHNIDGELVKLIENKAQAEGLSINKTIKKLLETALGVKLTPEKKNWNDFQEFCGLWTQEDSYTFEEKTIDTRTIDPEDWQ